MSYLQVFVYSVMARINSSARCSRQLIVPSRNVPAPEPEKRDSMTLQTQTAFGGRQWCEARCGALKQREKQKSRPSDGILCHVRIGLERSFVRRAVVVVALVVGENVSVCIRFLLITVSLARHCRFLLRSAAVGFFFCQRYSHLPCWDGRSPPSQGRFHRTLAA